MRPPGRGHWEVGEEELAEERPLLPCHPFVDGGHRFRLAPVMETWRSAGLPMLRSRFRKSEEPCRTVEKTPGGSADGTGAGPSGVASEALAPRVSRGWLGQHSPVSKLLGFGRGWEPFGSRAKLPLWC